LLFISAVTTTTIRCELVSYHRLYLQMYQLEHCGIHTPHYYFCCYLWQ